VFKVFIMKSFPKRQLVPLVAAAALACSSKNASIQAPAMPGESYTYDAHSPIGTSELPGIRASATNCADSESWAARYVSMNESLIRAADRTRARAIEIGDDVLKPRGIQVDMNSEVARKHGINAICVSRTDFYEVGDRVCATRSVYKEWVDCTDDSSRMILK
jgi:hypothetical protein